MSWFTRLVKNRRAKRLALDVMDRLSDEIVDRMLSHQDKAFDDIVTLAGRRLSIKVDAEQIRLTIAAIELERVHQKLVREKARHDAEIERIRLKYAVKKE